MTEKEELKYTFEEFYMTVPQASSSQSERGNPYLYLRVNLRLIDRIVHLIH
jgi:hypothetical protein